MRVSENGVHEFAMHRFDEQVTSYQWMRWYGRHGRPSHSASRLDDSQTSRDFVDELETRVARSFFIAAASAADPQPEPYEIRLRATRSLADAFETLRLAVEIKGYTLGLRHGYIATEEYGPSFLLLDQRGNPRAVLSANYTLQSAVENAWHTLQRAAF